MIYLIDASVYIFRAYFSLPDTFRDREDNPVQAVYGFANFLSELIEREKPQHIACAFDESLTSSYRNDLYPPYKANRELPPEELVRQLQRCRQVAEGLGIASYASGRYEADDIIGTLAKRFRPHAPVCVVTRDKDLGQLIEKNDVYWDYASDIRLDVAGIEAKMGVPPKAIPDLLGLMGDAVDNIPGVKGVGVKTAVALLQHFGSMDALYENLDDVVKLNIRSAKVLGGKLREQKEMAFLSRQLAMIECDMALDVELDHMQLSRPKLDSLLPLYEECRFGPRLARQAQRRAE